MCQNIKVHHLEAPIGVLPLEITHLKTLYHHSLCFLLTLHHTGNDFGNSWSPLLTIAHIKIRFSHKMKNDTPFMTEPYKGIHLTHRCKTITANGVNYISTLQNRCEFTKTSSIENVINTNLLTSENTFVVSSSSDDIKPYIIKANLLFVVG